MVGRVLLSAGVAAGLMACVVRGQESPTAGGGGATTAATAAELLEALKKAGVDVSKVATANEDGTVTVVAPAPPPPPPEVRWDNKVTVGFGVSDGNTERANVNAGYVLTRETSRSKLTFDATYFYGEDSGDTSENRLSTGVLHDWLFPGSRWLLFAQARYDYDEFQSWRHRFSSHAGPGYKLIDEEKLTLTLRAGAGVVKEWESNNDDWRPEGLGGVDFAWRIAENHALESTFRIFPDLDDLGEFRTLTTAAWRIALDKSDGLALTLGALHEYQSVVDAGRESSDLRVFGGLTFDF